MNTSSKKLGRMIGFVALPLLAAIFWPSLATAQVSGDLEVVFEGGGALFSDTNIAPGHSVTKTVSVKNNGSDTESVYTSVENESSDGLADSMNLTITATSTATTYFNNTFAVFFGPDPVFLGILGPGETRVYSYTATFDSVAGNERQGDTMGFDLIVGFEDGGSVSTGGGGGITTAGSGGGGSGPTPQIAGASTGPSFTWPWGDIWDGSLGDAIRDGLGQVLGEDTSAQEPDQNGEILGESDTTGTPSEAETVCWYWWLFVLAWAGGSGLMYYSKGWSRGPVSMMSIQLLFGALALLGLVLYFVFDQICSFWPSIVVALGSTVLFLSNFFRTRS